MSEMKRVLYACKDSKNGINGLRYLLENQNIALLGCLTAGKTEAIRKICNENSIPIYDDNNKRMIEKDFKDSSLDLIISFSYPIKIEDFIIKKAKVGINFHPAPLPDYKGRGCSCHAIYNGEKVWGGTFHILTSKLDGGGIIEKRYFEIPADIQYGIQLSDATWDLGYDMLTDLIDVYIKTGKFKYVEQEKEGTYYSQKMLDAARKINKTDSADIIEKKIKAFWFPPFEGAYIEQDGEHFSVITKNMLQEISQKKNA